MSSNGLPKKRRKNGSPKNSENGFCTVTVPETSTLTTAGPTLAIAALIAAWPESVIA